MTRVVFHIGPPKTGTSAVQFSLWTALRGRGDIVYPEPEANGPGHANLAWRTLGTNKCAHVPDALFNVVSRLADAGATTVVISSEAFSGMVLYPERAEGIRKTARTFPTELVVTLTPLADRLASVLQELIKLGRSVSLADPVSVLDFTSRKPGLQPDLLGRAFALARWSHKHVVLTSKKTPEVLFAVFSQIVGTALQPETETKRTNARVSYLEMLIMQQLDRLDSSITVPQRMQASALARSGNRQGASQAAPRSKPGSSSGGKTVGRWSVGRSDGLFECGSRGAEYLGARQRRSIDA